jgi:LAO/AO transport system kinase
MAAAARDEERAAGWRPPVLTTVGIKGEGIAAVVEALDGHWATTEASGALESRRRARLAERTRAAVRRSVDRWLWTDGPAPEVVANRLDAVAEGALSPYEVATEVVAAIKEGVRA